MTKEMVTSTPLYCSLKDSWNRTKPFFKAKKPLNPTVSKSNLPQMRKMTLKRNDNDRRRRSLRTLSLSSSKNDRQRSKTSMLTRIETGLLAKRLEILQIVQRSSQKGSSGKEPSATSILRTCWLKSMRPACRWRKLSKGTKLANRSC